MRPCPSRLAPALALLGLLVLSNPQASPQVAAAGPATLPPLSVGVSDEEFLGPLAGSADVKARFGAVGDGLADDTDAIQRGLDALRKSDAKSGPVTLYFPAGTYRITRTLRMRLDAGANLVGADPATTTLAWDGESGGTMLVTSGSFGALFTRLAWDGRGRARIGVAQWWNTRLEPLYQGSIEHLDETFRDLGIGISGGRLGTDYGQGDSETLIERVHFLRNSIAGVNVGSFNALNWWIWDSRFTDCARGASNLWSVDDHGPTGGAGSFMVYRSVFERSSVADLAIGNTGWFGFYDNVSIGSRQFLRAAPIGANAAPTLLLRNTILDTADPLAIQVGNEGPLLLLDNAIRSRADASGPAVLLEDAGREQDRDVLSLDNRFTVAPAIAFAPVSGRLLSDGDLIVARDGMATPALPAAMATPAAARAVFEVSPGANAGRIQAAIDAAAASGADNAVVHLAAGDYHLERTLVVPAHTRLQLAGDSQATRLWWSGPAPGGPMLRLAGPSYATLRDLRLIAQQTDAIAIEQADQEQGRIFIEASRLAASSFTGLVRTRVDAQANSEIAGVWADGCASILGVGGLGPVRLSANSRVLESDNWYEGDRSELFHGDSGSFTYLGGVMAPYSHGVGAGRDPDAPALLLDAFAGSASFVGTNFVLPQGANGARIRNETPATSALFLGVIGRPDGYWNREGSGGAIGLVLAKAFSPGAGARNLRDQGRDDVAFVRHGLQQARSLVWETSLHAHVDGATDVRLFRVYALDTRRGLIVTP